MRPGDFSPGNAAVKLGRLILPGGASMRPGDFSPGNQGGVVGVTDAGGQAASMRPGDFSPGNLSLS